MDREFRWSLGGFPLIGLGSEVNTNKHQPRFTQTQSPNVKCLPCLAVFLFQFIGLHTFALVYHIILGQDYS